MIRWKNALRNSVNALNEFAAEMKELRKQVKRTLSFAEELQNWYHDTFPSDSADAYAVLMAYTLFHYLLPNLGQTAKKHWSRSPGKTLKKSLLAQTVSAFPRSHWFTSF